MSPKQVAQQLRVGLGAAVQADPPGREKTPRGLTLTPTTRPGAPARSGALSSSISLNPVVPSSPAFLPVSLAWVSTHTHTHTQPRGAEADSAHQESSGIQFLPEQLYTSASAEQDKTSALAPVMGMSPLPRFQRHSKSPPAPSLSFRPPCPRQGQRGPETRRSRGAAPASHGPARDLHPIKHQ